MNLQRLAWNQCTGWTKEWALGYVNLHTEAIGSQEAGFTQPRDHPFAQPWRRKLFHKISCKSHVSIFSRELESYKETVVRKVKLTQPLATEFLSSGHGTHLTFDTRERGTCWLFDFFQERKLINRLLKSLPTHVTSELSPINRYGWTVAKFLKVNRNLNRVFYVSM